MMRLSSIPSMLHLEEEKEDCDVLFFKRSGAKAVCLVSWDDLKGMNKANRKR